MKTEPNLNFPPYVIERPNHSVLIVRMISQPYQGRALPDALFTFRIGEPQFEIWERRYFEQQQRTNIEPEY
jgi:hypothetical protein